MTFLIQLQSASLLRCPWDINTGVLRAVANVKCTLAFKCQMQALSDHVDVARSLALSHMIMWQRADMQMPTIACIHGCSHYTCAITHMGKRTHWLAGERQNGRPPKPKLFCQPIIKTAGPSSIYNWSSTACYHIPTSTPGAAQQTWHSDHQSYES